MLFIYFFYVDLESFQWLESDPFALKLWVGDGHLNNGQRKAIHSALLKPFSLIQGPPGVQYFIGRFMLPQVIKPVIFLILTENLK